MFLIVWDQATESDPARGYCEGDLHFEHLPLSYWLDYVRAVSPGSHVIVVQTKCDDGKAVAPPADVAELRYVTFSAKTGHNRDVLLAYLKQAFENELSNHQAHTIGVGRWQIKQTLRAYQESDESRPAAERQYRTLAHADFVRLCEEQRGKVSSPDELLRFLHNTGVVYHQPGLFQDAVILDQRWAIEAIYCIYDRKRTYPVLRGKQGRFKLSDLSHLAWNDDGFDVRLDKAEMGYKDLISDFMENLGAAPCVVAVISKKYLRSDYCMFELWRTWHNLRFRERLCPIVLQASMFMIPSNWLIA